MLFKQGYSAIFIAVGYRPARMGIKGENLLEVVDDLSFLRGVNLGKKTKVGKR